MKRETLERHLLAIQAKLEEAKEEAIDFSEIYDRLQALRDDIDILDDAISEAKESGDVTSIEEADALIEEVFSELRHEDEMGKLAGPKQCATGIVEMEL